MSMDKEVNDPAEEQFSSVLFSSESRLRNPWRVLTFSDRGSLVLSREELRFYGQDRTCTIRNITELDLTYAVLPWGDLLLAIVLAILMLAGVFFSDSLEKMIDLLPFFLFTIATATIMQKMTLWIKISYRDKNDNSTQSVCFSVVGWRRVLGGTLSLYKRIRSSHFQKAG